MARNRTPSIQYSQHCSVEGGFTLIELLLAVSIGSLAFAAAGMLFASSRAFIQSQTGRNETLQALRASLDNMSRDLRLGGACLPTTGDFSPLDGTNATGTNIDNATVNLDTFTSRTGLVRPNLTCIYGNLTTSAAQGATSLTVDSINGFTVGTGGYIYNGASGESFIISSIAGTTIGTNHGMSQAYTANAATVYAADERKYAIDTTFNPPALTLAVNGTAATPFASGIEAMNVQYRLYRNCPPCDTVDLPASLTEWQLVNELIVTLTARSKDKDLNGQYYRPVGTIIGKPRNLIPNG